MKYKMEIEFETPEGCDPEAANDLVARVKSIMTQATMTNFLPTEGKERQVEKYSFTWKQL